MALLLLLLLALTALSSAQLGPNTNCALCPGSGSLCCACCVSGAFSLSACYAGQYVSAGCIVFPDTATPTASLTPTNSGTPTYSPAPSVNAPSFTSVVHFTRGCTMTSWIVPAGVYTIAVYLWGSGGMNTWCGNSGYDRGAGNGAYVSGLAAVTPFETLTVVVGGIGRRRSMRLGFRPSLLCDRALF